MMPVFPSYNIKRRAKFSMRGKFFLTLGVNLIPILAIIIVSVGVICMVPGALDSLELVIKGEFISPQARNNYAVQVVNNYMLAISAFTVLFGFLQIGAIRAGIDIVRGKEVKLRSVFRYYDKWYIAAIWPLINLLISALSAFMSNLSISVGGPAGAMIAFLSGLFGLAAWVLMFKFIFVEYALADNDCKSFKDAFKCAWRMTKFRSVVSYVMLMLSFAMWFVIMFFTSGLLLIYIYPYMQLSLAVLYDANKGFYNKEVENK